MAMKLDDIVEQIDVEQAMKMRDLRSWTGDDYLKLFGLQRRGSTPSWVAPGIGLALVGAAVGVGLGLLFAPQEGRRLRADLRRFAARSMRGATDYVSDLPNRVAETI